MTIKELTQRLKNEAQRLGFLLNGVAAAAEPGRIRAFENWLASGYAGEMRYLEARSAAYRHPRHVLDGCRTMLMLALPYGNDLPKESAEGTARVARYAWGQVDYHDLLHERLVQLKRWLEEAVPHASVRGVVDTAPLLEREFAEAAGLGWIGKNTLLLNRKWGSYFFLAALLTDIALTVDPPQTKGFCGSCTACLDACPTAAFVQPYVLDATRCLSYLTIEHRSEIIPELAQHFDQWLFGCDICQEVCPWNRRSQLAAEPTLEPMEDLNPASLIQVLRMSEADFRERFRRTPLWRSKRRGLIRNAILITATRKFRRALPELTNLLNDSEPLIRTSAAWAIGQIQ